MIAFTTQWTCDYKVFTFDIKNLIMIIFQLIWFCAILPYIILSILCVKAVTLDGAWDGIKFLFTPDWERLQSSECWIDGGTQIFFSYGVGIGALLALGSYNKFHHNCYRYVNTKQPNHIAQ